MAFPRSLLAAIFLLLPGPLRARELPYFARALERCGVDPALTRSLLELLDATHPGRPGRVYHGLEHSLNIADEVARMAEREALSCRQKSLLLVSAALHDVDPRRRPETPPAVPATLEFLRSDPRALSLLEGLRRFGLEAAPIEALIRFTDYDGDPSVLERLLEQARAVSDAAFSAPGSLGDPAWARRWGRRLAFADKTCMYLGPPEAARRHVENLGRELRNRSGSSEPRETALLIGTARFLAPLLESPDLELLHPSQREDFLRNYAYFRGLAALLN